jgi:hypothetical protein
VIPDKVTDVEDVEMGLIHSVATSLSKAQPAIVVLELEVEKIPAET